MNGALAMRLPDGRLHLQHGPIDLICEAWGVDKAVHAAYARASRRFETVLTELVSELPILRAEDGRPSGAIGARMARAVAPFRPAFITPMAAVAGAVAETVLAEIAGPEIARAYVNNGGDIALHLAKAHSLTCAIAAPGGLPVTIGFSDPIRGIATSGWRGRSWSFGIADAVTVLATSAAMADAAATMIANAVNLPDHPGIVRQPARALQADSDLADRLVTTAVPRLSTCEIAVALDAGLVFAEALRARGLIVAAALFLQSEARVSGAIPLPYSLKEPVRV